jgi:xanthine dehydrogenase FAD-binding subunit
MVARRAYRPSTVREALTQREETGAIPCAGGTDLMVKRRRWSGLAPFFDRPVLFIGHLPELQAVERSADAVTISSACTLTALLEHKWVPDILKRAIKEMGSPAIRNVATIGGNICNASPAGDTLPVLYALDASLVLESSSGRRALPVEQFIKGPGETALHENELLTQIKVPLLEYSIVYYKKVGTRKANSLSKLSFIGLAKTGGGKVEEVRISFGAVAPCVVRSREIEKEIENKSGEDIKSSLSNICALYSELIRPVNDQRSTSRYRSEISRRLLSHFLTSELLPGL